MPTAALLLMAVLAWAEPEKPSDGLKIESTLVTLIEQVEVPALEAGALAALAVREGQLVTEGMLLGQIDDAEAQIARAKARIEFENAEKQATNDIRVRFAKKASDVAAAELKRAVDARERFEKSVSDSEHDRLRLSAQKAVLEIEQAQHEFEIAQFTKQVNENQLALADRNIARRKIVSPIAGVVVQVNKHRGEWVEPGKTVLRILRIDPLRAEGFVKADDVKEDLAGRKVKLTVTIPGRDKTDFSGKVVFVSPEINPVNGQIRVWAEIENRDLLLRPGMRGTLQIEPAAAAPNGTASRE